MEKKQFNWGPGLFLIIYQICLLVTFPFYLYYSPPSISLIVASIILLYLTGISITAGYHRFYSHRSYRTHPFVESILLFFASMAGQGSALRWAFDHRLHHAHVDTDDDPYSINKGFWYAHFFWILEKPRTIDPKVVPDLMKNKFVQFQDRYIGILMVLTNVVALLFVGWLLNDYMGACFLACWLRLFVLHHCTWFINSLAHTWGDKPFCQEQSAVNNYVIALLTFGEGYHNYHHVFANDYRNGIKWFHFDPTKWVIWTLNKLGLARDLKRIDPYTIKKRMILERKKLLLERLCDLCYVKKDEIEKSVLDLSERILNKIAQANNLKEDYYNILRQGQKERLKEIKQQLNQLKDSLQEDWYLWIELSRHILHLKPMKVQLSST